MSKRKWSQSKKNGEERQELQELNKDSMSVVQEKGGTPSATYPGGSGASVQPAARHHSETESDHSEQSQQGYHEGTDSCVETSQASGEIKSKKAIKEEQRKRRKEQEKAEREKYLREKREQKEKERQEKEKQEKERREQKEKEKRERKEKEKQEKEKRQPKNTDKDNNKRGSLLGRHKNKDSDVQLPVLSTSAQRHPSDNRSPSDTSSIIEADVSKSQLPGELQGDDSGLCTASVDCTLVVNHESQIDQLKIEIENLTAKQSAKDKEIDSLRREKEQIVTDVREALDKRKSQDAKERQTSPQNELETAAEEKDRLTKCHEENITEIKSVQDELLRKGSEVKQVTDNSETAMELHVKEIENLKAKYGEEFGRLQSESLRGQEEKETEIADLKLKVQEAEEKATNLEAELGKIDKEKENKYKQEIEKLQAEHAKECSRLREAKEQNETAKEAEIKEWKTKCHESEQEIGKLGTQLENLEKVKEEHETELKNIRAGHAQECSRLREAKVQVIGVKETEIKLWKSRHHKAEQEVAELATKMETLQKVKVEHDIELENVKAEHSVESSGLSREKEAKIEQWKKISEEAKIEVKQLQERLEKLDKEREDDKTCGLPPDHHMDQIKNLNIEIEGVRAQHANEIAELTSNLEGKNKLVQQTEERNEELRHQLDEAKKVHSEQLQQVQVELEDRHAGEIAAMKVNFEEKQKKEDQSIEQRVEKKFSQLEKASRDKFHELKSDNKRLKAEADKLRKETEEYLVTTKADLEKKDETINELEVQLKSLITPKEQEHEQEMTAALLKSAYEQKQKVHETQLQAKAAEIRSLSDQLDKSRKQMLALEHEKNEQLKKLKEDIEEHESRIANHTLEMANIRSEFAEQTSAYKKLQERNGRLEVELRMKKHLSAVTASNDGWIHSEEAALELGANAVEDGLPQLHVSGPHSDEEEEYHSFKSQNSLHQDNLTDTEKAELRRKLSEVLDQISDRDLKIKELEGQLSVCRKSLVTVLDEEIESAKVSSDTKEKMVPLAKVAAVKQMYVEATEKLVKAKEKHDRERKTLLEKLDDRQEQLEAERTNPPCSSEDLVSVEEMDHETAMQEVSRLRSVVFEKQDQILSLKMQVKAFESKCTQYNVKEKHSKDQSQAVKNSLPKVEPGWVKQKCDSTLEAELAKAKKKICDLEEEIGIYKSEVDGEKQNVRQEVEKSRHLEHKINQLHHENVHLQEQVAGYEKMNEEVGIFKARATNMLKRLTRSLLGKGEAEHSTSEKVDLECDDITKRLTELMEELEVKKIQAEVYKKDFEEERKEREEAAKKKDEEIAEMQNQFSKTVTEKHNELQSQLVKAHKDIENARAELENSKKLLEDALTDADQNAEKHKQELSDIEQVLQHNQKELQHMKARLDDKVHSLEDEQKKIALERDQLRDNRDKLREERDDLQKQVQDMCDENDRISSELKAKIKEAEIHAAGKNHIENEYRQLQEQLKEVCCVRDALQSELTEVKEQLERACADKVTLEGESLAKTQQVKQYKKQVDHYKAQLQQSSTRIEEYQVDLKQCNAKVEEYQVQLERCKHELAYCQTDLKRREEYEQNTADYVRAQYESELSTLKLEVGALKREKADMEVQLRQQQIGAISPDTARYVDQLQKERAESNQKYIILRDRYDVLFQRNDQLVAVLAQNNITVPNAKTPPQAQQHASTSPYQERVTHDGRHYNRQNDPNKSVTAQPGIGALPDHQLNYGHMQYQQGVGGVASSPPSMQRAGEGAVAAGDHHLRPHELLQENNLPQVAYNQGQPNTYPGGVVGHPSGGGGGVPVNYPQGYGQPQPPSAATYGSTYPESQNYSGMGMRPSDDIGAGQQGLMTPEPETGRRMASGPHENALIKGINTEIHSVAAGVGRQVDRNPEMDSLSPQAPFDPNLICPMCRLQYRIGEIQKYRKHVKYCQGT